MARSLYRSVTYGLEASLALAQTVAHDGRSHRHGHPRLGTLLQRGPQWGLSEPVGQRQALRAGGGTIRPGRADRARASLPLRRSRRPSGCPGRGLLGGPTLPPCARGRLGHGARGRRRAGRRARDPFRRGLVQVQDDRTGSARVGRAGRTPARRKGRSLPGQRPHNEFYGFGSFPWTGVRTFGRIALEPACEAGEAPQSASGRQGGCHDG